MKVHEIMTAHARCIGPENTLVEAAGLMRELDVGALPVCDNDRVTGIVTDRDIVLRGTANGVDPNSAPVSSVMSQTVVSISADQPVEEAVRVMEDRQIRRLPVLGRNGQLVGILSLGDIAISSNPAFSGMALRDVSEPRDPTARQQRLSRASTPNAAPRMNGGSPNADSDGGSPRAEKTRSAPARHAVPKKKSAQKGKRTAGARKKKTAAASRSRKAAARSR
jgi:CBS domain-containing protein